jgi:mono/diheme cytochrome c family protein
MSSDIGAFFLAFLVVSGSAMVLTAFWDGKFVHLARRMSRPHLISDYHRCHDQEGNVDLESSTRSMLPRLLIVIALLVAGAQSGRAQVGDTAAATRSIQDGVYTEAQARRGQKLTKEACGACHMEDWYTGTFLQSWTGTAVNALFELIRTTMPEDRPGALKRQQYADILAYIFELNGIPPGQEELGGGKETLGRILIEWRQ